MQNDTSDNNKNIPLEDEDFDFEDEDFDLDDFDLDDFDIEEISDEEIINSPAEENVPPSTDTSEPIKNPAPSETPATPPEAKAEPIEPAQPIADDDWEDAGDVFDEDLIEDIDTEADSDFIPDIDDFEIDANDASIKTSGSLINTIQNLIEKNLKVAIGGGIALIIVVWLIMPSSPRAPQSQPASLPSDNVVAANEPASITPDAMPPMPTPIDSQADNNQETVHTNTNNEQVPLFELETVNVDKEPELTPMPGQNNLSDLPSFEEPSPAEKSKETNGNTAPAFMTDNELISQNKETSLKSASSKELKEANEKIKDLEDKIYTLDEGVGKKMEETDQKIESILSVLQKLENTISSLEKEQKSSKTSTASNTKEKTSTPKASKKKEPIKAPVKPKQVKKTAPKKSSEWTLRSAQPGKAIVAATGSSDLRSVSVGDSLPSIGKISYIGAENGRWVVKGSYGYITQ